jgi:hypothetical protein
VKYGGLPAFAALCAPGELHLFHEGATGVAAFARDAYRAANAGDALTATVESLTPDRAVDCIRR